MDRCDHWNFSDFAALLNWAAARDSTVVDVCIVYAAVLASCQQYTNRQFSLSKSVTATT